MRPTMGSLLLALALCGAAACNNENAGGAASGGTSSAPAVDIGETLATVNGMPIGSKEFEQAAARKAPASGDSLSLEEKKEVLDGLVEEKLLYAEALKKGLDKDPKVQKVMVNTLLREDVYSTVKNSDFTDDMLQKYYEDHKSEFVVPEKVQIKRILIKVTESRSDADAKKEAERLQAEVKKSPDSFKDVAAKYSEDPYKRRGGDVGFVSKEGKPGLDPAIVDKAFGIATGEVSEVFKTTDGYNIVQVAARREAVERTFQQMKGSVLRKVKNEKMKELYDSYVAKLKTGADIKPDEAKLSALEIKNARRPFSPGAGMGEGEEGMVEEGEAGEMGEEGGGMGGPPPGAPMGPGGAGGPMKGAGPREGKIGGKGPRPGPEGKHE
jgi:peptidyl-prolyl cis-trans isomerase C